MFNRIRTGLVAGVALAAFALPQGLAAQQGDIVETAVEAGAFETLVAAVQAAGLVETLQGDGPFTVFAPTDEAFAKLPEGTVQSLLRPENRAQLIAVLTYHVVPGKVTASQVVNLTGAATVQGQRVDIAVESGNVMIDGATVVTADVMATNGVIHVIDEVILPANLNIVETAQSAGMFETLLAAATAAGFATPLTGDAPLTVFAPTDEAFAALPEGTVESLLAEEGMATLKQILSLHVVEGRVYSDDARSAGMAGTLAGESLSFSESMGALKVNGANIVAADLDASNGVIHVIDQVILPTSTMGEGND